MKNPTDLMPVMAKIHHQNSLGVSVFYEVVYFDDMYDKEWKSYSGSKTFEDGERVESWTYCHGIEMKNK